MAISLIYLYNACNPSLSFGCTEARQTACFTSAPLNSTWLHQKVSSSQHWWMCSYVVLLAHWRTSYHPWSSLRILMLRLLGWSKSVEYPLSVFISSLAAMIPWQARFVRGGCIYCGQTEHLIAACGGGVLGDSGKREEANLLPIPSKKIQEGHQSCKQCNVALCILTHILTACPKAW